VLAGFILLLVVGAFLLWIPIVALVLAAAVMTGLVRARGGPRG
jgi:hypothetical protein